MRVALQTTPLIDYIPQRAAKPIFLSLVFSRVCGDAAAATTLRRRNISPKSIFSPRPPPPPQCLTCFQ